MLKKMHELRYYQEVLALSQDIDTLWLLKCRYIFKGLFQEPSALKIYYDGEQEWLFDFLPTKSEASKVLVEASLPMFRTRLINGSCRYRGLK